MRSEDGPQGSGWEGLVGSGVVARASGSHGLKLRRIGSSTRIAIGSRGIIRETAVRLGPIGLKMSDEWLV